MSAFSHVMMSNPSTLTSPRQGGLTTHSHQNATNDKRAAQILPWNPALLPWCNSTYLGYEMIGNWLYA